MDYFTEIKKQLEKNKNIKNIKLESTFKELNIDSLDLLDLAIEIEKKLDFKFTDDDLMNMKSINDVVETIKKYK